MSFGDDLQEPREPASALDGWPAFAERVRARLEAGQRAYGDASFARPPAELVDEIEQELLDVCGWAFVLHERLRRLRAATAAVSQDGPAGVPSTPADQANGSAPPAA